MKKIICLLIISFLSSCATNQCINDYLEIENNKKSYNFLSSEKISNFQTLKVYLGVRLQSDIKPKYFNLKDFNYLKQKYKSDTIKQYWTLSNLKKFKYLSSTWDEYLLQSKKLNKMKITDENYLYCISKPLIIKNKKLVIFYLSKRSNYRQPIDDLVVVMKKEKGKYIVVEKIYNTDLY